MIGQSEMVNPIRTLFAVGTIAGLTDAELLERFASRGGEEAEMAFAALLARHGPMVLSVCRGLLRDRHDSEDAFQATFLVLARKAGSLRRPDQLAPWLYGVAHRASRQVKAANHRRRLREREAAMLGNKRGAEPDCGGAGPVSAEAIEVLHAEIERLPERYRTAIVLCGLGGLTHEEAARRLSRPVGTVSTGFRVLENVFGRA